MSELADALKASTERIRELEEQVDAAIPCDHVMRDELSPHCLKCDIAVLNRRIELLEGEIESLRKLGVECAGDNLTLRRVNGELEAELSATQLKWRRGKPPQDGWYWINKEDGPTPVWIGLVYDLTWVLTNGYAWAGPILPPEE